MNACARCGCSTHNFEVGGCETVGCDCPYFVERPAVTIGMDAYGNPVRIRKGDPWDGLLAWNLFVAVGLEAMYQQELKQLGKDLYGPTYGREMWLNFEIWNRMFEAY